MGRMKYSEKIVYMGEDRMVVKKYNESINII